MIDVIGQDTEIIDRRMTVSEASVAMNHWLLMLSFYAEILDINMPSTRLSSSISLISSSVAY